MHLVLKLTRHYLNVYVLISYTLMSSLDLNFSIFSSQINRHVRVCVCGGGGSDL